MGCSPRGDAAGFVEVVGLRTLLIPDRRGNNRLDSLRNFVADPRVALLLVIPGIGHTLSVNGSARLVRDEQLSFRDHSEEPATGAILAGIAADFGCAASDAAHPERLRTTLH